MALTPYYSKNGITIYCGDNLKVLPKLEPFEGVIITDPPYGVGKAEWDAVFPTQWIAPAFRLAPRVLCMPGNSALMQAGFAFGFTYRDLLILRSKNGMTRSKVAFGNYIPVIVAGEWPWEARPNLIEFVVNSSETINHPSPKPLPAMRALFHHYVKPEWLILDPFLGSGTTLKTAQEYGYRAIGVELDEEHCKEAVSRLSQQTLFSVPANNRLHTNCYPTNLELSLGGNGG